MSEERDEPQDTFYRIPHTHWEGAVYGTRRPWGGMGFVERLEKPLRRVLRPQMPGCRPKCRSR